jgi:hypothetical protein
VNVFIVLAVWSALRISGSSSDLVPELASYDLVEDLQQLKPPARMPA